MSITNLTADAAELALWKGRTLLPRSGCRSTFLPLGNASVWAEYEMDGDRAVVLQVLVNGSLIDPESYVNPLVLEGWETLLSEDFKRDMRRAA